MISTAASGGQVLLTLGSQNFERVLNGLSFFSEQETKKSTKRFSGDCRVWETSHL